MAETTKTHPYAAERDMESELPDWWENYDREGPMYRTDGTPLHRKCLPSLWMTAGQHQEFLDKKDEPYWLFEDDFENMWTGYVMTVEEAKAEEARYEAEKDWRLDDELTAGFTVQKLAI